MPTPEPLFRKTVAVADGAVLTVTREVDENGEDEILLARPPDGQHFGDWRDVPGEEWSCSTPSPEAVERAVSDALGFRVGFSADGIEWEGDKPLFVFDRLPDAPDGGETSPADRARLRHIEDAERRCMALEERLEAEKAVAKATKDELDLAIGALRRLCRAGADQPGLFDGVPAEGGEAGAAENAGPCPAGDDAWRQVPLEEALEGLPRLVLTKLAEAELTTMGQLSDFCKAKGDFSDPYQEIPGIGPTKAEQLREAEARFWGRWKERQAQEAEDADGKE